MKAINKIRKFLGLSRVYTSTADGTKVMVKDIKGTNLAVWKTL